MADTYQGSINEFVDWVDGTHEITGASVTGGLPVSGGSIRELLAEHLKQPFVYKEDTTAGLYRLFSSESAYRLWLEDPEENAGLELFSFVRPSDYELTTDLNSDPRYIISGNSDQLDAQLSYRWTVRNDKGERSDETATAKYTIVNGNGTETSFSEIYSSAQRNVRVNLYDYLSEGTNSVIVTIRGNSTGAIYGLTIVITVLTLQLTSTFDYNIRRVEGGLLSIPYTLKRNDTSHACSVYLYIDGVQVEKVDIQTGSTTEYSSTIEKLNTYASSTILNRHVSHTLQLFAEMAFNNNTFRSNLIYYTFETASEDAVSNYFVNVKHNFANVVPPVSNFVLYARQYQNFTLNWGYYTDQLQNNTSIPVTWKLESGGSSTTVGTIQANKGRESDALTFVPNIYNVPVGQSASTGDIYLVAYYGSTEIARFTMIIEQSSITVYETPVYDFKLNAYGKTNGASNTEWKDEAHNVEVAFTGISWDNNCGWHDNSFRVSGVGSYAVADYKPLENAPSDIAPTRGTTIEVEFMSEKVVSSDDVLIRFGDTTGAHIDIMPSKAALYDRSGALRIYTNYKANERIKLAFIINEQNNDPDSRLLYIVNKGVLERGASGAYNFANSTGKITIGGSASGVRVYNMRVYTRAITYADEYNNYAYDSDNKSAIINRNNVINQSTQQIDYDLCCNKLDTILISGDLTDILNSSNDKDQSITDITIERFSPFDTSYNFRCEGCMARKHGQSTLNYPISSIKIWFNKSVNGAVPTFTCDGQRNLGLAKNRYVMKDGCTPANKYVLQANYADSSGVHNGGIQRMIQQTWFDAVIDGEHKLRTIPQLFVSNETITHNNQALNEDGTVDGENDNGKQWDDYLSRPFPYSLEVAPNSFPCVVFYRNTAGDNRVTYLGQYVFMEDKKSDFNFGERSIYKAAATDPYCLTIEHKNDDTAANRIWNNNKVLRMEVININTTFSSYMSMTDPDNVDFDAIVIDSETNKPVQYRFEQDYELIYPDPDDVEGDEALGTDKFGANSKFLATVQPFLDWYGWLVSTYQNHTKFRSEAAAHIDLYKMAAYYIFPLRLGLVDSLERNAQIKTYDGQHFHYEPWDIDIALGNKNTGGIAFDPPIDRTTTLPTDSTTWAYSGHSSTTSNWLFDALEAWDEWMNVVVPKVAQALYAAGLTYDNLTKMFDEDYAARWCEILYNESGYFKYVVSRGGNDSWLEWLQGARTSHRHWWLSTSMDYYDAKWGVGDFRNHFVYIAANHDGRTGESGQDYITIVPNGKTYFSLYAPDNDKTLIGPIEASPNSPALMDITSLTFSNKVPRYLYGALFMEEIDLSCLASRMNILTLGSAYSSVLGAPLKALNIGVPFTQGVDAYHYNGGINGFNISVTSVSNKGEDAFENLQVLNMRGQRENAFSLSQNIRVLNRNQLRDFYAMGSTFTAFYSSQDGNSFGTIELPGVMTDSNGNSVSSFDTLNLHNSTWQSLTFWDGVVTFSAGGGSAVAEDEEQGINNAVACTRCNYNGDYALDLPASLSSVILTGSTCEHANSWALVKKWIQCIVAREGEAGLADKTLILDGIHWTEENIGAANLPTYNDMRLLAMMNNGHNKVEDNTYKGYIVLNSSGGELTSEQLTQLKAWFGDPIFSLKSSGLILDHKYGTGYVQINVGSEAYMDDGNIYLEEGKRASLNATKFILSEDSEDSLTWGLRAPGSSGAARSSYRGVQVVRIEDITYLVANESAEGDRAVEVVCVSTDGSSSIGSVTVNIVGMTYPTAINIASAKTYDNTASTRSRSGGYTFWSDGIISEFYLDIVGEYMATITGVTITLTNGAGTKLIDNESYTYFKTDDQLLYPLTNDSYLKYRKMSSHDYGLTLACDNLPANDGVANYTLTFKVAYKSGRVDTKSCTLMVVNDAVPILTQLDGILYDVVSARYIALYGSNPEGNAFYKGEMAAITGSLSFYYKTGLTTLVGSNSQSILRYLPNVTQLDMRGCSSLLSTDNDIEGEDKRTLVFDGIASLTSLDIYDCTKLTGDIDLRNNSNVTSVNGSAGSSTNHVNILLPERTKVTTISLRYPTKVNFVNPTVLTPSGVIIAGSDYLESVDIVNIPNGQSFDMLVKVMKW